MLRRALASGHVGITLTVFSKRFAECDVMEKGGTVTPDKRRRRVKYWRELHALRRFPSKPSRAARFIRDDPITSDARCGAAFADASDLQASLRCLSAEERIDGLRPRSSAHRAKTPRVAVRLSVWQRFTIGRSPPGRRDELRERRGSTECQVLRVSSRSLQLTFACAPETGVGITHFFFGPRGSTGSWLASQAR